MEFDSPLSSEHGTNKTDFGRVAQVKVLKHDSTQYVKKKDKTVHRVVQVKVIKHDSNQYAL